MKRLVAVIGLVGLVLLVTGCGDANVVNDGGKRRCRTAFSIARSASDSVALFKGGFGHCPELPQSP